MKYLGPLLVVALVAGQVPAWRINENDSPLELFGEQDELRKVYNYTVIATEEDIRETVGHVAEELTSRQEHMRATYNEKFHNFLIRLKDTIREGNETLGIPQLDPFETDLFESELHHKYVNGFVKLTDVKALGLAGYRVDKAEIAILKRKITVGLTWPSLYSSGSYKFNVVAVDDIKAYGEGNFTVTATDLEFETQIWLSVSPVSFKKMETNVYLGGLALSVTGLFNDEYVSAVLSEVLSDVIPQLIQDHQDEISAEINERIMYFANEKLAGMTPNDLLALIN